jgi:hypothetical protein
MAESKKGNGNNGNRNVQLNQDNGQLIFVSDLEGCAKKSMTGTNQSTVVCSDLFFDKLDTFLSEKPLNKVAFLGDYFDKGDDFENNIKRIVELYEKHNFEKKTNGKPNLNRHKNIRKVHIILGNRDINKLRLLFEYNYENPANKQNLKQSNSNINKFLPPKNNTNTRPVLWPLWSKFYKLYFKNLLSGNGNKEDRLKIILADSMGAGQPDYTKVSEYFSYVLSEQNRNNNVLGKKINFTKLFTYGLIADYDRDYQVLLSHAGGIGSFLFHNQSYYDNIMAKFTPYDGNILTYFNNIEVARRELMKKPKETEINTTNDLVSILSTINSPLKNFLLSQDISNPNFYLLQALGLKPDNVGTDHFVSFVQSCDCILCKGPLNNNIVNASRKTSYNGDYESFLDKLELLDIQFVAFGHNPVCTPVPLIYRRPENPKIIFIANDVSNGYRPANIEDINQIPLSYIEKTSSTFKVGVGAFRKLILNGNTKYSSMLNSVSTNLPGSFNKFKPMIKKWSLNSVPMFNRNNKTIKYNANNMLTFPSRTSGNPFSPAVMNKKINRNAKVNA